MSLGLHTNLTWKYIEFSHSLHHGNIQWSKNYCLFNLVMAFCTLFALNGKVECNKSICLFRPLFFFTSLSLDLLLMETLCIHTH